MTLKKRPLFISRLYLVAGLQLAGCLGQMVGQLLGHLVGQASGLGLGGSGRLESGLEAGLEAVVAGGPEEDLRHPVHLDLQRRPRPHLLEGGRETVASGRAHFELSARRRNGKMKRKG